MGPTIYCVGVQYTNISPKAPFDKGLCGIMMLVVMQDNSEVVYCPSALSSDLGAHFLCLWYNRISTVAINPLTTCELGAILGVGFITTAPSNTGGLLC